MSVLICFTLSFEISSSHANLARYFGNWETNPVDSDIIPLETSSGKPLVLCTIPKNGCTRWRLLAWRILGGNCSHTPHAKKFPNLLHPFFGRGFWESSSHIILVRNPYTRFLSWYNDKIQKNKNIKDIDTIEEAIFRLTSGNLTDEHHTRPQSAHCGQLNGLTYDSVYKIENISVWYPNFIKRFNLNEIVETGWEYCAHRSIGYNTSCFYSPKSHSCESYTRQDYPVIRETGGPGCRYTSHSTCTRKPFNMTPSQAQAITNFYKEDFIRFGYPTWDGAPDNFQIM